jgi:hypothetical protein
MQNRRWKPIGTRPNGLQHLVYTVAAQRYMGQRAISILRCAAQENLRLKYRELDRSECLLIIANWSSVIFIFTTIDDIKPTLESNPVLGDMKEKSV